MSRKLSIRFLSFTSLLIVLGLPSALGVLAQQGFQHGAQRGVQRAQRGERIVICHHNGNGSYVTIVVPPIAMNGHFDAQGNPLHSGDYISTDETCGTATPTPSGTPGNDPDPTPEPISILLFGAGIAGVGIAARKLRRKGASGTTE